MGGRPCNANWDGLDETGWVVAKPENDMLYHVMAQPFVPKQELDPGHQHLHPTHHHQTLLPVGHEPDLRCAHTETERHLLQAGLAIGKAKIETAWHQHMREHSGLRCSAA